MANIFLFFILGFLSCQYILPILDSVASVILGVLEIAKAKISFRITKINEEIEEIQDESTPSKIPLGFSVPTEYIEEESEEDCE